MSGAVNEMESDREELVRELTCRLGYRFSHPDRLQVALTHKSYANENRRAGPDNQRYEFIGDAVLGLVVAEVLMDRLPDADEGELTSRRAALVNESNLAESARRVGLGDVLLLGKGEEHNNGRDRSSILADAVEAILAAVFLDGGYEAARDVVLEWLSPAIERVVGGRRPDDPKTALQERLQSLGKIPPAYRVVGEEGPDHAKVFEVQISSGEERLASGRGCSKKDAEKAAARNALEQMEISG